MCNSFLSVFLCGVFGGFLSELLKWYRIREQKELPLYAKSIVYWAITILIVLSGGILAVLYGIKNINPVLAVNIGISAPLIIQNLSKIVPVSGNAEPLNELPNEVLEIDKSGIDDSDDRTYKREKVDNVRTKKRLRIHDTNSTSIHSFLIY